MMLESVAVIRLRYWSALQADTGSTSREIESAFGAVVFFSIHHHMSPGCSSFTRGLCRQPHTEVCGDRLKELMRDESKVKNQILIYIKKRRRRNVKTIGKERMRVGTTASLPVRL